MFRTQTGSVGEVLQVTVWSLGHYGWRPESHGEEDRSDGRCAAQGPSLPMTPPRRTPAEHTAGLTG